MNTMNKEFVPYEQALELKELGFDEPCFTYYHSNNISNDNRIRTGLSISLYNGWTYDGIEKAIVTLAPLYQQAFRWFRDKKLCDGSVCRHGEADGGYSYRWDIVYEYGVYEERHFKQGYKTYEEAELACLIELIEIVKNK